MKRSKAISDGGLSAAQVAECRLKSEKYGSTFSQELFLASGGALRDWYASVALDDGREEHKPLPGYSPTEVAIRLSARLESSGELNPSQSDTVVVVSELVACAISVEQAQELEEYAFQQALRMVAK